MIVVLSGKVVVLDLAMRMPGCSIVTTTPYHNLLAHGQQGDVMAIGIMIYEILTGTRRSTRCRGVRCRQSGGETQRPSLSYTATARRTC